MKAAVIKEYGKFSIEDRAVPEYGEDEVLVNVKFASICGSDQHLFKGEFHPRTKLPLVPGHEFSGVIAATGKNVKNLEAGEKVTIDPIIPCGKCQACKRGHFPACSSLKLIGIDLDGGFAEYVTVRPEMIYPLPESVSLEHAALVEVLSIGFHAVARAEIRKEDSMVIFGAGKIGQSILHAATTVSEGRIFLVDILDERLQLAARAFPEVVLINAIEQDPVEIIMQKTDGHGVDVAFEAVGHHVEIKNRFNPVRSCIKAIRGGGKVCVLGLGNDPHEVLMKELIWKEAMIIASRVSHGEFAKSIAALSVGKLNPISMITSVVNLEETQKVFSDLENNPEAHLKILISV